MLRDLQDASFVQQPASFGGLERPGGIPARLDVARLRLPPTPAKSMILRGYYRITTVVLFPFGRLSLRTRPPIIELLW